MVFNNKKASFRVTLIIALIVAMYGLMPNTANAQAPVEPNSQGDNCYPGSGWMWTAGPAEPDIASHAGTELAQQGIHAFSRSQRLWRDRQLWHIQSAWGGFFHQAGG